MYYHAGMVGMNSVQVKGESVIFACNSVAVTFNSISIKFLDYAKVYYIFV